MISDIEELIAQTHQMNLITYAEAMKLYIQGTKKIGPERVTLFFNELVISKLLSS